jgi:hypothetical protein
MFAAGHIAMFAGDDGGVFCINAFRLRRGTLLFHWARIAAFAAAIRHIAARGRLPAGRGRIAVFHWARAFFATGHCRVMRLIRTIVVSKNHDRKSEDEQHGNCQNYSFFHYLFPQNLEIITKF